MIIGAQILQYPLDYFMIVLLVTFLSLQWLFVQQCHQGCVHLSFLKPRVFPLTVTFRGNLLGTSVLSEIPGVDKCVAAMSQALLQICYNYSVGSPLTKGQQGNDEDYKLRLLTRSQEAIKGALHFNNALMNGTLTRRGGFDFCLPKFLSDGDGRSIKTMYYSRINMLPRMDSFSYQCITDLAQSSHDFQVQNSLMQRAILILLNLLLTGGYSL